MKVCNFLLPLLCLIVGLYATENKYTTKYDNVDIDEILKNDRLLKRYVDCLLDEAPCTPDGAELKSKLFIFSINSGAFLKLNDRGCPNPNHK